MTEEKFTELVNLYLDKEISERGLAHLKDDLAANADRKKEFAECCRMHQAMRMALKPQSSKRRSQSRRTNSSSSSRSARSSSRGQRTFSSMSRQAEPSVNRETSSKHSAYEVTTFPRWVMGTGFAASLALGLALLMPVFRDTTAQSSQAALKGVEAEELLELDPLDRIGHREIRRFANLQVQREANQRASLAARLRLMGLNPELTPKNKQLRTISVAAAQRPEPVHDHAELLVKVQKMSPIPTPQILRVESIQSEPAAPWPGSFQSSLASFK